MDQVIIINLLAHFLFFHFFEGVVLDYQVADVVLLLGEHLLQGLDVPLLALYLVLVVLFDADFMLAEEGLHL